MSPQDQDIRNFLTAFGKRVKALRKEKGLTQVELEARSGLDVRQIQRIEAGDTNFTIGTGLMLAKGLSITISELFQFF